MKEINRGSLIVASILIATGVLLFIFNLIPGTSLAVVWPLVFFFFAAGFFAPALIWPYARQGLAALFIPGAVFFTLGMIFFYNTLSQDWLSWAYAWILIPGGVGVGLALAGWAGEWGHQAKVVGLWLSVISLAIFSLLATIFGSELLRLVGPVFLIGGGIALLLRSFIKPNRSV